MPKNIILAHGILGFGSILGLPVNYFNGVADHFRQQDHIVFEPQVNPIGSVQQRGEQLATAIKRQLPDVEEVHIIAHSMGGLDARYALAHDPALAERIKTLVTIGTPHRGSPVADAIANPADPIFAHIPTFLLQWLKMNTGGLHDLTTQVAINFDETTPDVDGVRYIDVAGDASQGGHELFLFQLAAIIGRFKNEINDGVVTRSSALREGHEHLNNWPVDHAGEVGWSFDSIISFLPQPHLARFDELVDTL